MPRETVHSRAPLSVDDAAGADEQRETNEEILADDTDLAPDDLLAALAYAARLSDARRIALAG